VVRRDGRHGRAELVLAWEPKDAGFVELEASVEAGSERSSLTRTFAVQAPLRALYLGQRVQGAAARLAELVGNGLKFESWQPTDASTDLALERFDLVVLDDLPSEALGAERQRELVRAVNERGLGLFVCGGEASFGPGGYHDAPLAECLPVECVQKGRSLQIACGDRVGIARMAGGGAIESVADRTSLLYRSDAFREKPAHLPGCPRTRALRSTRAAGTPALPWR